MLSEKLINEEDLPKEVNSRDDPGDNEADDQKGEYYASPIVTALGVCQILNEGKRKGKKKKRGKKKKKMSKH